MGSLSQHSRRSQQQQHHHHHDSTGRVVQASYLEKYAKDRKNLLKRLKKLVTVLQTDETIEPDSPEWPGLPALSTCLVENFVDHSDKEIRLFATLACMEIFAIVSCNNNFSVAALTASIPSHLSPSISPRLSANLTFTFAPSPT